MIQLLRSILPLLACIVVNAAKIIVDDRPGEGDHTTIQAAVSAAWIGDRIVINPHSDSRGYREEVTITTSNLKITGKVPRTRRARTLKKKKSKKSNKGDSKGGDPFPFDALDKRGFPSLRKQPDCPDVFLDGCDEDGSSCDNTVLTISAPGVIIENLFIRHGDVRFTSGSDGSKFSENCVLGDSFSSVQTSGTPNSLTISKNFFQGGDGPSVSLDGDSHEISSNLVVPCDNGFDIDGDDGIIKNNKMFGCNDKAIDYEGDRGTIRNNGIYHGDFSIEYDGADGIIVDNTIIGVFDGIDYFGDNGRITDNKISSVEFSGIDYFGDNGIIMDNEISFVSSDGIEYDGDNPTITDNTIEFIQDVGINTTCTDPSCTGGTVLYNEVIGGADDNEGIEISNAKNFLVEGNTISYTTEIGLLFSGDASTMRGNIIARCGTEDADTEHGMEIHGSQNIIEENELNFNTFDGINQDSGSNNVYRRNTIKGNGRAGIRIESGTDTDISDNTIINNHGEGIAIEGGSGTDVFDNELRNNRIDICNDKPDTFAADNTFTTGGFFTLCEPGLS